MTWLGYFRPVLSCSGIIPLALTLGWSRQTKLAAVISPILGFCTGLAIWLSTAYHLYGSVSIDTTSDYPLPALYGAIGSFFSPAIYSPLISLYKPYKFDWREFLRIELADEAMLHRKDGTEVESTSNSDDEKKGTVGGSGADAQMISSGQRATTQPGPADISDEKNPTGVPSPRIASVLSLDDVQHPFDEPTLQKLRHWQRIAWIFFVVVVVVTFVAWPMPLYRDYIFTKTFFSGWTAVAIIWQFVAFGLVVVFPIWDGCHAIAKGSSGVMKALRARIGNGSKRN